MGKILAQNVALTKDAQKTFHKNVKNIKHLIKKGELKIKNEKTKLGKLGSNQKRLRGVVYLGHLPAEFTEKEMTGYFRQFGSVCRVRHSRSENTGKSKGYGFVEFADQEVAAIVATTMNNYLMKNRLLKAEYVPPEKQHKGMFAGKNWSEAFYPRIRRHRTEFQRKNKRLDEKEEAAAVSRAQYRVKQMNLKLASLGVDYKFQFGGRPAKGIITKSSGENKKPTKKKDTSKHNKQVNKPVLKEPVKPVSEDEVDDDVSDDSDISDDSDDSDDAISWDGTKNKCFVAAPVSAKPAAKKANKTQLIKDPPKGKNKKPKTSAPVKQSTERETNKLLQRKKGGGIEKQNTKISKKQVPVVSKTNKLAMGAAELMKEQKVPKLKEQKIKIKSRKSK